MSALNYRLITGRRLKNVYFELPIKGTTWLVEGGKTYVFYYYLRHRTSHEAGFNAYLRTTYGTTYGTTAEPANSDANATLVSEGNWDANKVWTRNLAVFTPSEPTTVNACFRWLSSNYDLDEFFLAEIVEEGSTYTLSDLVSFSAPAEDLETPVSYVRNFSAKGVNADTNHGWQTICLPFDVDEIIYEGRSLFANEDFWLYEITGNGFAAAEEGIKAHTPYLIAMPNDASEYEAGFNVSGNVTFIGSTLKTGDVAERTVTKEAPASSYRIVVDYQAVHGDTFYGIRDNSSGNQSVFVKGTDYGAFWAYAKAITEGNFESFSIFDDKVTSVRSHFADPENPVCLVAVKGGVELTVEKSQYIQVCTLGGQLVKTMCIPAGTTKIALPAGAYIVAGQKIRVTF